MRVNAAEGHPTLVDVEYAALGVHLGPVTSEILSILELLAHVQIT